MEIGYHTKEFQYKYTHNLLTDHYFDKNIRILIYFKSSEG